MGNPLETENLNMVYGTIQALKDVTFHVSPGETFVLLGPNGAGKSTCIEILEGFRKRTSGHVTVLGKDPNDFNRADRASLGIVLQQGGDLGRLSVREIVSHFASLYPNPRAVDEVIDAVNLSSKADQPIKKLSGGQQHRVDVALGIIGNPKLLFLDEPTTGFDPEVRRQFWEVIRGLQSEGTTIMLTTHYLDEAEELADRAGIIIDGKLVAVDNIQSIGGVDKRRTLIRWRKDGQARELYSESPSAEIAKLHSEIGELEALEVGKPTLERVYLEFLKEHGNESVV